MNATIYLLIGSPLQRHHIPSFLWLLQRDAEVEHWVERSRNRPAGRQESEDEVDRQSGAIFSNTKVITIISIVF